MSPTLLAVKQKRLKDWSDYLQSGVKDSKIRAQIKAGLQSYQDLIVQCFEAGAVSPEDAHKMEDLDRILTQLNEEARLNGRNTIG